MKLSLFIWLLIVGTGLAWGQGYGIPFYGKNKVIETKFDWRYIETPHFRVYYYNANRSDILPIAEHAETSYDRLSKFLNVAIDYKIPLIYYHTHIDFEQTNLFPGFMPPGILAFAEPIGHRVVVQGDKSREELFRTITHELGHIFEYAILYDNISSRRMMDINPPPLWLMEGFSDFATQYWDSFSLMTVRDVVLQDMIPELRENGEMLSQNNRTPYDMGHLMLEFIYEKHGQRAVKRIFESFRNGTFFAKRRFFLEQLGYTYKSFNFEFKKYARSRFAAFASRETPDEYSSMIGPDFPFAYSFSHRLSPSGELLAIATVNYASYQLELVIMSVKDGKVIKRITPGYSTKYDDISIQFDPADGSTFSWDQQGRRIVFFARKEFKQYLVMVDAVSNAILKRYLLPTIQNPSSPVFHNDGVHVYFTASERQIAYIYRLDCQTGKIDKCSSGKLFVKTLGLSPDGSQVVFSAKRGDYDNIYLAPLARPDDAIPLTSGNCNDITPEFSLDGKRVFFSSDACGAFNVYSIDLASKVRSCYSNVKTANYFPLPIPGDDKHVIISSFYKGSFVLFKKDVSQIIPDPIVNVAPAITPPPAATTAPEKAEKMSKADLVSEPVFDNPLAAQSAGSSSTAAELFSPERRYKPFEKLYVDGIPSVGMSLGTDGSFFGSTYVSLSDLTGDHNITLLGYTYYGYRSFSLSYVNQHNRIQFAADLFSFSEGGYYDYQQTNYMTVRSWNGGMAALFYPFNRSYRAELAFSLYKQSWNSDFIDTNNTTAGMFFSGWSMPLQLALVGETTRYMQYGPNAGATFKLEYTQYIPLLNGFQSANSITADYRKYLRLNNEVLFAFRANGFMSRGAMPRLFYSGGNNTLRATDYMQLLGDTGFFINAEFRFPLIQLALTPIGLIGPVRGVFFFDSGAVWNKNRDFSFFEPGGGIKLKDGLASYGFGVEFFMFGLPMHVEWVYGTNFSTSQSLGTKFWIGYDF